MKFINKYKVDKGILISLILFFLISIITIFSAQKLLSSFYQNLALKQILWYILGFILVFIIMKINNKFIYDNIWILYIIGVISLFLLLLASPLEFVVFNSITILLSSAI